MPGTQWRNLVVGGGPLLLLTAACGPQRPPANFAPDPGLAARIEEIRIDVRDPAVCPGAQIRTSYSAVLDDGSLLPFSREYDADDPPDLHVIMLRRFSPEATPRESGDWVTDPDPLRTALPVSV